MRFVVPARGNRPNRTYPIRRCGRPRDSACPAVPSSDEWLCFSTSHQSFLIERPEGARLVSIPNWLCSAFFWIPGPPLVDVLDTPWPSRCRCRLLRSNSTSPFARYPSGIVYLTAAIRQIMSRVMLSGPEWGKHVCVLASAPSSLTMSRLRRAGTWFVFHK